jgi:N utilization substance protein B
MVYGFQFKNLPEVLGDQLSEEFFERLKGEDDLYRSAPGDERDYIEGVVRGVHEHLPELDGYIEKYSQGWTFGRLPRVAVAAMRVAMFEVLYRPDIPNGAALNEAVEIVRHYEPEEVVRFCNGILGSFMRGENPP